MKYGRLNNDNVLIGIIDSDITTQNENDILLPENISLIADDGCAKYKYLDGELVERTAEERNADWIIPAPQIDQITELQLAITELAEIVEEGK